MTRSVYSLFLLFGDTSTCPLFRNKISIHVYQNEISLSRNNDRPIACFVSFITDEMLFSDVEMLFRDNKIVVHDKEKVFRYNEMVFGHNELVIRYNEIITDITK